MTLSTFDRPDGKYYPPEEDMEYLKAMDKFYYLRDLRKQWKIATKEERIIIEQKAKDAK